MANISEEVRLLFDNRATVSKSTFPHNRNENTEIDETKYTVQVYEYEFIFRRQLYVNNGEVITSKRRFSVNDIGCSRRAFYTKFAELNQIEL